MQIYDAMKSIWNSVFAQSTYDILGGKRIMKRLVFVLLTISLSLFTPCFAAEPVSPIDASISGKTTQGSLQNPSNAPQGAREISLEEVQIWLDNNEEELQLIKESSASKSATASWVYTSDSSNAFYYYAQELSYSCGPASVRMALKALSNLMLNENVIRTGCGTSTDGTYIADMTSYMTSMQSDYSYSSKYSILSSLFHSNLYNAVSDGAPPIVGIKTSTTDGWFYNTSGHFIVPYAVMSDKSSYALADPWGGYAGVDSWKWYTKSASDLWGAYSVLSGYSA